MSDINMTNPCNNANHRKYKPTKGLFEYREDVVKAWQHMGVPLRPAEVASIEMQSEIHVALKHKLTAEQTARMLYSRVTHTLQHQDGTWFFQQKVTPL